jgi:hypothetical protein
MRATNDHMNGVYERLTSTEVDQYILENKLTYDLNKAH